MPSTTRRLRRLLDNPAIRTGMVSANCPAVAGRSGQACKPDPFDFGWHENRFRASIADGWSGLSQTSHPDCLDLGQTYRGHSSASNFGLAGLCAAACCPREQPFCWSATVNSERSKSCASWKAGIGTMSCVRKPVHMSAWSATEWKDFGSYIPKAGQSVWLGKGCLTEKKIHFSNRSSTGNSAKKNPGVWQPTCPTGKCPCRLMLANVDRRNVRRPEKAWF